MVRDAHGTAPESINLLAQAKEQLSEFEAKHSHHAQGQISQQGQIVAQASSVYNVHLRQPPGALAMVREEESQEHSNPSENVPFQTANNLYPQLPPDNSTSSSLTPPKPLKRLRTQEQPHHEEEPSAAKKQKTVSLPEETRVTRSWTRRIYSSFVGLFGVKKEDGSTETKGSSSGEHSHEEDENTGSENEYEDAQ